MLLTFGCDDTPPPSDGGPGDGDVDAQTGDASMSFIVTWGSNPAQQFHSNGWQTFIDLNVFSPQTDDVRDTRMVFMLCEASDTTCESPVVLREVGADETNGDPIQESFGPEVTVTGLPTGTYQFMIFADTGLSRSRGHGWDADFASDETAWAGAVSELDVMLSDPSLSATTGVYPPPAPTEVTLTDGSTTELGTLVLQHVHEQNRSPSPPSETGVIAVAVQEGVRLIDVATHQVVETTASSGAYTFEMTDSGGAPFPGTVCGMVRGPSSSVFVLFDDDSVGGAGYAVQFDIGSRAQPHTGNRVLFPGGDMDQPCRGVYAENGGQSYLFVTNASASRHNGPETEGSEGFWHANVSGLDTGDVDALRIDRAADPVFGDGIDDMAAHEGQLYLSVTGSATSTGVPPECRGTHCVFVASYDEAGLPTLAPGGNYDFLVGPVVGESYPSENGDVECVEAASPWAAITVAPFHDGRTLLFLGACLEIAVFDLADGSELDLSEADGVQGLDGTVFGSAFNAFALSPDGATLWSLAAHKSFVHFNLRVGIEEPERRQTFNRYMAFPIDLSSGAEPALHPAFVGDDLDGFNGVTDIGTNVTPVEDPGVDINYTWYVRHQVEWLPSTAGATFQSASIPFGPAIAVTPNALWVRGSGAAGQSGLGKGGNLAVYDLATRRAIFWPPEGEPFYRFWAGGPEEQPYYLGFDLTPDAEGELPTRGIEYFATP